MPKGQYARTQGLKRNRLSTAEKATKAFSMSLKRSKVSLKANGVAGAVAQMSAGMPPRQEVKGITLAIGVAPATPDWSTIIASPVANIVQGVSANHRIGRQIRVVGVIVRATVLTADALLPSVGLPFTIDMIWDKQPNGALAPFTTIYDAADHNALPNMNNLKRFDFWHRLEVAGSQNGPARTINIDKKCNKLVSFDTTLGTIADIETNNLIVCWSGHDTAPSMAGYIRILYVDA